MTDNPTPCPDWCNEPHDSICHGRDVGDVEVAPGMAIGVSLFQSGDMPPELVLYIHTNDDTQAIHMSALDADALRANIRVATDHLLGDHYR